MRALPRRSPRKGRVGVASHGEREKTSVSAGFDTGQVTLLRVHSATVYWDLGPGLWKYSDSIRQ